MFYDIEAAVHTINKGSLVPFINRRKRTRTREGNISGEIVGCACLRQLQMGQFFYEISTTDISVYFI